MSSWRCKICVITVMAIEVVLIALIMNAIASSAAVTELIAFLVTHLDIAAATAESVVHDILYAATALLALGALALADWICKKLGFCV